MKNKHFGDRSFEWNLLHQLPNILVKEAFPELERWKFLEKIPTGLTTETNCLQVMQFDTPTHQRFSRVIELLVKSLWIIKCEKPRGTIWWNYTNEGMESSHLNQPTKCAPSPQINSHASPQPTANLPTAWHVCDFSNCKICKYALYTKYIQVLAAGWMACCWFGSAEGLLGMEVMCGAFPYFFFLAPIVRNRQFSYSNYDPGWYPYCQA